MNFTCWIFADSVIKRYGSGCGAVVRLRFIDWMRLFTPCVVDFVAQMDKGNHHRIQLEPPRVTSRDCVIVDEWILTVNGCVGKLRMRLICCRHEFIIKSYASMMLSLILATARGSPIMRKRVFCITWM